jgi:hypothetical protein
MSPVKYSCNIFLSLGKSVSWLSLREIHVKVEIFQLERIDCAWRKGGATNQNLSLVFFREKILSLFLTLRSLVWDLVAPSRLV